MNRDENEVVGGVEVQEHSRSTNIKNRLQSIIYDSQFVQAFAAQHRFPLVSNERCGPWYVPSSKATETSYFKSTDGHVNEWQFSMRRLNLHLLPILGANGGMISVDSTRRGKLIPDSLSKTIPIWCAVLNCILFQSHPYPKQYTSLAQDNWLRSPEYITDDEHRQIVEKIPAFVEQVTKLGLISRDRIVAGLAGRCKPLIPCWSYPEIECAGTITSVPTPSYVNTSDSDALHIICLTASVQVRHGEATMAISSSSSTTTTWDYIQGSGDDHELWATKDICGGRLDPSFFWNHIYTQDSIVDPATKYIRNTIDEHLLLELVNNLGSKQEPSEPHLTITHVKNARSDTGMAFGKLASNIAYSTFLHRFPSTKSIVVLSDKYRIVDVPEKSITIKHISTPNTKKGSKSLRHIFPDLVPSLDPQGLLVLCETGTDLSVGLVVLLLCKSYDTDWFQRDNTNIDKDLVKQHLGQVSNLTKVNPSRNTLQSINEYLIRAD